MIKECRGRDKELVVNRRERKGYEMGLFFWRK